MITLYSGITAGTFYELPASKEFPNSFVLSCEELEFDYLVPADSFRRYRAHNRLVSNLVAYEVKGTTGDRPTIAYVFTPGIGEVQMSKWSLRVVRRSAYNDLIESQTGPAKRPENQRSALRVVLRNAYYLVYEVTNVATLVVPTIFDQALSKAISNHA